MSSGSETPPRIVKKINKHGGAHGGAWKVAYADFVTAMMALFIVLWVLSQNEKVKESVSAYFKDPVGFSSKSKILVEGKANPPIDLKLQNEMQQKEAEKLELEKIAEKVVHEISADTELKGLAGQIKIEVTKEAQEAGVTAQTISNFETVVANMQKMVEANPAILKKMSEQTGLSETELKGWMTYGEGPTITIGVGITAQGASGNLSGINIEASLVNSIDNTKSTDANYESTLFSTGMLVLHEAHTLGMHKLMEMLQLVRKVIWVSKIQSQNLVIEEWILIILF